MAGEPPSLRERQEAIRRAEQWCTRKMLDDPTIPRHGFGPAAVGYEDGATGGDDRWWRVGFLRGCQYAGQGQRLGVWYQCTDQRRFKLIEEEEPPSTQDYSWVGTPERLRSRPLTPEEMVERKTRRREQERVRAWRSRR